MIDQVAAAAKKGEYADKPVVACLGLAFKANIDDLRESPALEICRSLPDSGKYQVLAVEPNITQLPECLAGKVELQCADAAIRRADIVLLLVDHRFFSDIGPDMLNDKHVIDTRGMWRS